MSPYSRSSARSTNAVTQPASKFMLEVSTEESTLRTVLQSLRGSRALPLIVVLGAGLVILACGEDSSPSAPPPAPAPAPAPAPTPPPAPTPTPTPAEGECVVVNDVIEIPEGGSCRISAATVSRYRLSSVSVNAGDIVQCSNGRIQMGFISAQTVSLNGLTIRCGSG